MNNFSPPEVENGLDQSEVDSGWRSQPGFTVEDPGSEVKPVEENNIQHESQSIEDYARDEEHSAPRKKKSNDLKKRLDQLVYEKGTVEQNNAFLSQQLAQKEAYMAQQQARIQQFEEQLQEKDQYANEYFENSLDVHEKALKQKIRQAKENGDIDEEVEFIDQLAELKATKSTHASWKVQEEARRMRELQNEDYEPYDTYLPQTPYVQQSPQDLEIQEWRMANPWYDNPNLRNEFDSIAGELSNILSFNGQNHLIGTSEFRESVTNEMRQRYGMGAPAPQQQYEEQYPTQSYQSSPSAVAPVTRRVAPTMAHNYMNQRGSPRNATILTKEEMDLARNLPPRSNSESVMDLYKRYEKGKNYPKSPLPGGSPHRLTIL